MRQYLCLFQYTYNDTNKDTPLVIFSTHQMHTIRRCECVREFTFEPELLFMYPVIELIEPATLQNAQMLDNPEMTKATTDYENARYLLCQQCKDRTAIVKNHHRENVNVNTIIEDGDEMSSGGETSPEPLEASVHGREGGFFDFVSEPIKYNVFFKCELITAHTFYKYIFKNAMPKLILCHQQNNITI